MNDLIAALYVARPGAKWNLSGPNYSDLEWLDDASTKPTSEELENAIVVAKQRAAAALVKSEARRRILAAFPDWKQANMTARGVELQDIWRRKGNWTVQEQAEADALQAAWDWIKSVRAASDAIEALQPIPGDYAENKRWPA